MFRGFVYIYGYLLIYAYLMYLPIFMHICLFLLDSCIESLVHQTTVQGRSCTGGAPGGPSNIVKGGPTNRQRSPGQLERLGFRLNPRFPLKLPPKSIAPITKKRIILEQTFCSRMLRFFQGGWGDPQF